MGGCAAHTAQPAAAHVWCAHTRARVLKDSQRAGFLGGLLSCVMWAKTGVYGMYVAAYDAVFLLDAGASTAAVRPLHLLV